MRTAAWIAAIIVILLVGGYAFATGGTPARKPPEWLTAQKIAHRGLWTEGPERPENSLAAFEAAAAAGFAVELDAHLSADGEVVVVHDSELDRMTGEDLLVEDLTVAELQELLMLGPGAELERDLYSNWFSLQVRGWELGDSKTCCKVPCSICV